MFPKIYVKPHFSPIYLSLDTIRVACGLSLCIDQKCMTVNQTVKTHVNSATLLLHYNYSKHRHKLPIYTCTFQFTACHVYCLMNLSLLIGTE